VHRRSDLSEVDSADDGGDTNTSAHDGTSDDELRERVTRADDDTADDEEHIANGENGLATNSVAGDDELQSEGKG
jgi:hypothetical protein